MTRHNHLPSRTGNDAIKAALKDADFNTEMVHAFAGEVLMSYSLFDYGTYRAEELHLALGATRFTFATPQGRVAIRSPLSGRVNVYNLVAAMCAALARGLTLDQIAAATPHLRQVPGRFEVVPGSREANTSRLHLGPWESRIYRQ